MKLVRSEYRPDGIFGQLTDAKGHPICHTLEHSYNNLPKLPPGQYICVRGMHKLHSTPDPFETFEITGVPGHGNILFHWGNYNKDSDGCVLLGDAPVTMPNGEKMIPNSKAAFAKFMKDLTGIKEFMLTVF